MSFPSLLLSSSSRKPNPPCQKIKNKKKDTACFWCWNSHPKIQSSNWCPFHKEHLPKVGIICLLTLPLVVSCSLNAKAFFFGNCRYAFSPRSAWGYPELKGQAPKRSIEKATVYISRPGDLEAGNSRKKSLCFRLKFESWLWCIILVWSQKNVNLSEYP